MTRAYDQAPVPRSCGPIDRHDRAGRVDEVDDRRDDRLRQQTGVVDGRLVGGDTVEHLDALQRAVVADLRQVPVGDVLAGRPVLDLAVRPVAVVAAIPGRLGGERGGRRPRFADDPHRLTHLGLLRRCTSRGRPAGRGSTPISASVRSRSSLRAPSVELFDERVGSIDLLLEAGGHVVGSGHHNSSMRVATCASLPAGLRRRQRETSGRPTPSSTEGMLRRGGFGLGGHGSASRAASPVISSRFGVVDRPVLTARTMSYGRVGGLVADGEHGRRLVGRAAGRVTAHAASTRCG